MAEKAIQATVVKEEMHADIMQASGEMERLTELFGKGIIAAIRAGRPTDAVFKSAQLKRRIATLLILRNGALNLALVNSGGKIISKHTIKSASATADYTALWAAACKANNLTVKPQKNGVIRYLAGIVVLN